jgi:hypothetical protein
MSSPAGKLLNGQAPLAPILRSMEKNLAPEKSLRTASGAASMLILPQPDHARGAREQRARLGDNNANVKTLAAPAPKRLRPASAKGSENVPREQFRFHAY